MKILWLVNIVMPELAEHLGRKPSVFGGWLTGALNAVRESGNELVICTTNRDPAIFGRYVVHGVTYYIVPEGDVPSMQAEFRPIIERERPDVVHLYGTEFEHTWALASLADPDKSLVSVQGLVSYCAEHVFGGVPDSVARDTRLHRFLRRIHRGGASIEQQKTNYLIRSQSEINTLKRVRYVNGGTAWGDGCAKLIQPDVNILPCELILRDSFYDGRKWNIKSMEKHSIFTLYSVPLKGFDMFLRGLHVIVQHCPDAHAYVVGNRCAYRNYSGLKKSIMNHAPDYDWYIQSLIEQFRLKNHITFLGYLPEDQMREQFVKSHVFVSASAIENHSTALGEAMISGVPSVASCVGGLQEMIDHGKDGFLYPFNETYRMAEYVLQIFQDDELACALSKNGHDHAARTYSREKNTQDLLAMYETIYKNAKEAQQ